MFSSAVAQSIQLWKESRRSWTTQLLPKSKKSRTRGHLKVDVSFY